MVRQGPIEVVDFAMKTWLKQMEEDLSANEDLQNMSVREKIHLGIKTRLQLVVPYQDVWPQAMALGLQPRNFTNTLQQIHSISD